MKNKNFLKLIIALIVPQLFAIVGSLFTNSSLNTWYAFIAKPSFNPPNWIFGPVWITLFFLMGVASFLIWRKGLKKREIKFALVIFVFQLILNLFWSYLFFTLQNPGIAFTEIISLWFAILATFLAFYQISKPAAYLLIPYILWVAFAAVLNFSIWNLNSDNYSTAPVKLLSPIELSQESEDSTYSDDMIINDDTVIEFNWTD